MFGSIQALYIIYTLGIKIPHSFLEVLVSLFLNNYRQKQTNRQKTKIKIKTGGCSRETWGILCPLCYNPKAKRWKLRDGPKSSSSPVGPKSVWFGRCDAPEGCGNQARPTLVQQINYHTWPQTSCCTIVTV